MKKVSIRSLEVKTTNIIINKEKQLRGASGQTLASRRWGHEFASRSLRVGFVVDETESGYAFLGVPPVFPCHKFHSTISPYSCHSFRLISFHQLPVTVRQAWSVGILAIHRPLIKELHRISSLDPVLCLTRAEDKNKTRRR